MSKKTLPAGSASRNSAHSGRRSFIAIAGAALSAPLAAVSPSWLPPSGGSDPLAARLAHLEDLNAIRALNQAFARHVTDGAQQSDAALFADPAAVSIDPEVRAISKDGFAEQDTIEIAPDRRTATARLHVILHTETEIGPACTVVDMARQQGSGVISASRPVLLDGVYARDRGSWRIVSVRFSNC
jgi:hypothetical protein